MRFSVLGPIEIDAESGERHTIGSANQRAILAMLLARHDRVVAIDELMFGLWGDEPPPTAIQSLRTYISRLRKIVGDRLMAHDHGYSLDCSSAEVDAHQFEADVTNGRFSEALERWRGRPYGDAGDLPVVRGESLRLEALARTARAGHLDALLTERRLAEAVAGAEAAVAEDGVDEAAWSVLVRALARSGRTADALRAYQRAVHDLADAGLEPGADLRSAESEALQDRPAPVSHQRRQVPNPLTPLVGRDAEVDRLAELIASRRLVTIVGAGGVGKTRLAVEVGRAAAARHGLGARSVELARIADSRAIRASVRRALDLGGREFDDMAGLGAIDALLVLDNCEHVIEEVASEIPVLLSGGDRLTVLATSREPLGVVGEVRWSLAPLSTVGADAPALHLFISRARDVGVELDPADPLAHTVVGMLDGLPLATEMAAVRLATIGLADLARELEQNLGSLEAGHRGVETRHSTLRAVLAWSEALLSDEQRAALMDFSVFAGAVTARHLPAVITAEHPVALVCELAERSLVTVDVDDGSLARYGSLDTIRQFGREGLRSSGRLDQICRRHAEWFLARAEDADSLVHSTEEAIGVGHFDEMFDEIRAAHRWCRDHDPPLAARLSHAVFWTALQGLRTEVFDWSSALATSPHEHEPSARLCGEIAEGLTVVGRLDEATMWAHQAIDRATSSIDRRAAYGALTDIALYNGELEEALGLARHQLELADDIDDVVASAYARAGLALALAYLERNDEALDLVSSPMASEMSPTALGWLAYARGEILLDTNATAALRELDASIALAESVGNHYLGGVAHVSAVSLRARTGDIVDAPAAMARTIRHFAERGDAIHLLTTLRNLPTLLVRFEQWHQVAEILGGVSSVSVSPTYGAEADRLDHAESKARFALGSATFSDVFDRSAANSLQDTAREAIDMLESLAGSSFD